MNWQRCWRPRQIDELLLAIPSASRARRAEIIDRLEGLHCKVKLVPGMADVVSGNVAVDAIREVEIEDLLGRESVAPDAALLARCITGKVVLVSGRGRLDRFRTLSPDHSAAAVAAGA